ncbi:hypothetical protein HUG17_4016 [Dermatophagoides farinae]|uniref:Tubulin-specific chaperone cofactor E-like protein n=1 Tax=Dermatophagoides farinae TaxID=6954 RepID=A0A9D4SFP8_DERFA|nr:tubulin-specific chaperone cofactor E-like protein [Dermatophagoides farinae]KAH7639983.1 hypothetical protein HUG17_4016 [Dermatophagoides farinae]
MASTTTTTTASRRSTTTPGTQSIHIANEQQKQQQQQQQQHRINSRMNAGLSIPRSRHHHYRYRRTTLTFVDVLIQRYGVDDVVGQFDDCPFEVFVLGGISPRKSESALLLPPALSLNQCCVKNAGPEPKIRELCHNVEELDLASNNIIDIDEVYKIVRAMPNLRFINLSENDLSKCNRYSSKFIGSSINRQKLEKIKSLVLNNTHIPWSGVELLLNIMPSIVDLHLSLNNYESIQLNAKKSYPNIKFMYLSGNPKLCNWNDIKLLMKTFPKLEGLTMADCNIVSIPEHVLIHLKNLVSLNISNWPINEWSSIDRLNQLPKLIKLRCQGLNVLNKLDTPDERRQHLIARLPRVTRLNGSDISDDERVFAERAFIRWFISNTDELKPPRFYELQNIHGRVEPLAEVNLSPPKYANVRVIFNDLTDEQLENDQLSYESLVRQCKDSRSFKVDLNKSVRNFKVQLSSLYDVIASNIRVFYIDTEMSELLGILHIEELRFAQKKLYTYNVQDGDEFLIEMK